VWRALKLRFKTANIGEFSSPSGGEKHLLLESADDNISCLFTAFYIVIRHTPTGLKGREKPHNLTADKHGQDGTGIAHAGEVVPMRRRNKTEVEQPQPTFGMESGKNAKCAIKVRGRQV
jgi:hypothetical protein